MLEKFFWCFCDPRGRLNRQEFVLSIFAILTPFILIGHLIDEAMFGPGPIYYRSPEQLDKTLAMLRAPGNALPSVLLTWPLLAITLERFHDIGRTYISLLVWLGFVILAGTLIPGTGPFIIWGAIGLLFFLKGKDAAPVNGAVERS
jgi:uncharacterized membrane protein YhaH (DUF805 family)